TICYGRREKVAQAGGRPPRRFRGEPDRRATPAARQPAHQQGGRGRRCLSRTGRANALAGPGAPVEWGGPGRTGSNGRGGADRLGRGDRGDRTRRTGRPPATRRPALDAERRGYVESDARLPNRNSLE